MTTITISSSSRHYAQARELASDLLSQGYSVFTPHFDFDETKVQVSPTEKARLTTEFFEKVSEGDFLLVNCVDGYSGLSVSMEIGYATALNKPIIFSEEPAEPALRGLGTVALRRDGHLVIPQSAVDHSRALPR